MDGRIRLIVENGIADVRLNRPDKMNALDPAMFEAIAAAGAQIKHDPSVRAVVLSGEGRAFCAGLDLERRENRFYRSPILRSAPMASPTLRSIWCGSGASFRCR